MSLLSMVNKYERTLTYCTLFEKGKISGYYPYIGNFLPTSCQQALHPRYFRKLSWTKKIMFHRLIIDGCDRLYSVKKG